MAGTVEGGRKAIETRRARLGEEGLRLALIEYGRKGGLAPKTKPSGFQVMDRQRLLEVSSKGGSSSRRRKEEV